MPEKDERWSSTDIPLTKPEEAILRQMKEGPGTREFPEGAARIAIYITFGAGLRMPNDGDCDAPVVHPGVMYPEVAALTPEAVLYAIGATERNLVKNSPQTELTPEQSKRAKELDEIARHILNKRKGRNPNM